jgi:hypothetical protein
MMVALLLYGYCIGIRSSRAIHRATWTDVAFRAIAAGIHPHFTSIAEFRQTHREALAQLFHQSLQLARKAGLVSLGHVAIDGTKIQGNASKHKAMSYERMRQTEERLKQQVDELLKQAEAEDHRDDQTYGKGKDKEDLPPEVKRRKDRLAVICRARQELEKEAKETRAQELRELADQNREKARAEENEKKKVQDLKRAESQEAKAQTLAPEEAEPFLTPEGLPKSRTAATPQGEPTAKAQRNFTDADSRIMERGGGFLQGYNCQAAVDDRHQIIVACAATNQSPDNGNLVPMIALVKKNFGEQVPELVTADCGYWQVAAEEQCRELGSDVYIALRREKHGVAPTTENGSATTKGKPPMVEHPSESGPSPEGTAGPTGEKAPPSTRIQMKNKLESEAGKSIYRKRKSTVEPVFGQMKEARGLRRLQCRGLSMVNLEWSFECACHNLMKLFRQVWKPQVLKVA